jgi:glycosyltransferase involved in cell wall biosynthesis
LDDYITKDLNLSATNVTQYQGGPRIEILSEHLETANLIRYYKSCDAFVLPTHAEGSMISLYVYTCEDVVNDL